MGEGLISVITDEISLTRWNSEEQHDVNPDQIRVLFDKDTYLARSLTVSLLLPLPNPQIQGVKILAPTLGKQILRDSV